MNSSKPAAWRTVMGIVSFLPILFLDGVILYGGLSGESEVPGFWFFSLLYLAHFAAYIIDFTTLVSERRFYSHEMFKANHRGISVTAGVLLCLFALINLCVWLTIAFGGVVDEISTLRTDRKVVLGFCTIVMFFCIAQTIIMAIYDFKQPKFMPMYTPYGMPQQPMPNGSPYGMPQQPMPNGSPYGMPQQQMLNGNPYGMPQQPMPNGSPYGMPQQPMSNGNPYGMPQQPMSNGNPYGMPQQPVPNENPYGISQDRKKLILEKEPYGMQNESTIPAGNPYYEDRVHYSHLKSSDTVYAAQQDDVQ